MDSKLPRTSHRIAGLSLAVGLAVMAGPAAIVTAQDASSPQPTESMQEAETMDDASSLSVRPGLPPAVTEGIPHIQLDQTSSPEVMDALATWAFSLPSVAELPSAASLPGARALTLADDLEANPEAMIVGREFGHIHADPGAGSLHLRLPVDEAAAVIDAGWGVWHPFHENGSMPGLIMVFSPRDEADLESIQAIIEASVEYAGG